MRSLCLSSLIVIAALLCSCAQLPNHYEAEKNTAVTGTNDTALALKSISERQKFGDESRDIPLYDGVDAFYARAMLIKAAERSFDFEYFL
jgi:hypothetical protein